MTGRMPQEGINPIELPPEADHVWLWFLDLNAARQSGLNGGMPLSHAELVAFFWLERITPSGWELQALRALDRVAFAPVADK